MKEKPKIFFVYFLFFLLLFLQFPLSGSLPGKTDCWWHLATFSDFINRVHSYVHHIPATTSYYPAKALWLYGEPSFGIGALYMGIHTLLNNYIWSFYLLYVLLFSLTAFTYYLLAGEFVSTSIPRIVGGFFFTLANFSLGHLDHHNTFFWAIAFLALWSLYRLFDTRSIRWLYAVFILWGLQIYFSTTIFIYLSVWIFILMIIHYRNVIRADIAVHILTAGSILFLLIAPLLLMYLFNPEIKNAYNPSLFAKGSVVSNLWLSDYLRFLPGNMIYPVRSDIDFDLLYNIKCASPGITLLFIFIYGFKELPSKVLLLALLGLVFACGAEIKIGYWSIPMPMKLYYSSFHDLPFLRTPIRAYFMVHWVICIGAVYGLNKLGGSIAKKTAFIFLILMLFLFENIPFRLSAAGAESLIEEGTRVSGFIDENMQDGVVLHLPSQIFPSFPIHQNACGMNTIGREYYYSFMQTMYDRNSINGSAGYFPHTRMDINEALQLRSDLRFKKTLERYNVRFVILHKDLMVGEENYITDSLLRYSFLHFQKQIDSCYIFKVE